MSVLRIHRHRAVYETPRDHPDPPLVRARLDDAVRNRLARDLRSIWAHAREPDDDALWFIRRLDLRLAVDAGSADPDALSRFWAERISQAIASALASGEDGTNVIRFRSRAAWAARFLGELCAGRAWSHWFFTGFDSLRSLPAGAAIARVLLREPELAASVFLELAETRDLAVVLARIQPAALPRVAQAVYGEAPRPEEIGAVDMALLARVRDLAASAPLLPFAEPAAWRMALSLYLYATARSLWPASDPAAILSAAHTAAMLRAAEQASAPARAPLPAATSPAETSNSASGDRAALNSQWAVSCEAFASRFAAAFLLLPSLDAMGIEQLTAAATYPPFGVYDIASLLRYIVLSKCLGACRPEDWNDPALQLASGAANLPAFAEMAEWSRSALPGNRAVAARLREICPRGSLRHARAMRSAGFDSRFDRVWSAVAGAVLSAFARRCIGFARSSYPYLYRNFLQGEGWITPGPGLIAAELPRSPLDIVMRLAGIHNQQFAVPWIEGREIRLLLASES